MATQFLIFHLGNDRYGLDTHQIVRILPLLEFKNIPRTPDYVAGLMNFHGTPVPVIDLSALICSTRFQARFDTRIVLTDYRMDNSHSHLLGLIAERVAGIAHYDAQRFEEPGIATESYLGKVNTDDGAILQLLHVEQLLPETVRAILFQPSGEAASC